MLITTEEPISPPQTPKSEQMLKNSHQILSAEKSNVSVGRWQHKRQFCKALSIKAKELLKRRFSSLGITTISDGGREKRITNHQEEKQKQTTFQRTEV